MGKTNLRVGDKIIDYEKIYSITDIQGEKIFYQPFTPDSIEKDGYVCSIPQDNLPLACLRPLMTQESATDFLEKLQHLEAHTLPPRRNSQYNNGNYWKDVLYHNDPVKTGKMLVCLSQLKKESQLSHTDETVFDQALNHLVQELSLVLDRPLDSLKEVLLQAITRN